jgi:hypothetical protein
MLWPFVEESNHDRRLSATTMEWLRGDVHMFKSAITDKWLIGITAIGFFLYMGLTGFVVLNDKPLDYYTYLSAAYALAHGENIYVSPSSTYENIGRQLGIVTMLTPYANPTLTALLIVPLTFLPLRLGAAIWVGLSGLAALVSGLILCSFTTEKWKQRLILLSTVAFVPILSTMNAGQVNLFALLATVASLYCLRQDRNVLGGIMLSISILLKPFAIGLVPLMIWHKKWKALGGLLLGGVMINLFSMALFGISSTLSQFSGAIGAVASSGLYIALTVQNLNGLLGRFTSGVSEPTGTILYLFAAGLIGAITVAAIVLKPDRRHFEIESALLITATHLIVPRTWYHHLTMLMIILAFVIIYWNVFKLDIAAMLLLSGLILTDIHGIVWKQLSNLHPVLSNFPVLTTLYLWGLALKMRVSVKSGPGGDR